MAESAVLPYKIGYRARHQQARLADAWWCTSPGRSWNSSSCGGELVKRFRTHSGTFVNDMEQVVLSLISGVLGAVVGGTMTVFGSRKVLSTSMANLERAEIRKLRVECVTNLAGLRFLFGDVLPPGQSAIPADAELVKFMFEMNRIPMLWADDPEVMNALRNFSADTGNKDKLFAIIRATGKTTSLGVHNLSDVDMNTVLRLSRPTPP